MFVDILVNTIHFAKHKWNFLFDNFDLFWRQDFNFPLPNPTKTQNCVGDSAKGGCWVMGHICFSTYKHVFSWTNVSTLVVRPSLLLDSKHLSYRIPCSSTVRAQLAESTVHGPFPGTCKGPYIPANSAGFQVVWNGRISWHCWFWYISYLPMLHNNWPVLVYDVWTNLYMMQSSWLCILLQLILVRMTH